MTSVKKLTLLECNPATQVLDNVNLPRACDNCLIKADFDLNTASTCSPIGSTVKFFDFNLEHEIPALYNTYTRYYLKLTILNYHWADVVPLTSIGGIAVIEALFAATIPLGTATVIKVDTNRLPTLSTSPVLYLRVDLNTQLTGSTNANFQFASSSTLISNSPTGTYLHLVKYPSRNLMFVPYVVCNNAQQILDPVLNVCKNCSTQSEYGSNTSACTSPHFKVKFYEWAVYYSPPVLGLLPTEHLILFEIKNYTWGNVSPVTSSPGFFSSPNLEGAFENIALSLNIAMFSMFSPPTAVATNLRFLLKVSLSQPLALQNENLKINFKGTSNRVLYNSGS